MASKPTISDVAARAGVSKGAVSFALNGRAGVSADTRARILRAASDLGFTPNATARALSTRRSGTLGLVICRPRETARSAPGIPPFIAGIESALAPSGHLLSVLLVDNEDAEAQAYRELARAGRVDGVFVTDLRADDPRPALLEELGVAAVTLNRPTVPSAAPAVCVDEESALRDAVEHLVRLGHHAIGHVGGPRRYLRAARRHEVWADVLCKFSLSTGLYEEADVSATGGAEATRSMFDAARPPTAILYASDLMAMTGLAVAQQLGLRIPEDLSVVGFDDGETSVHLRAPLCTVRTDAFGWGRAAATALQACIAGEDIGDIRLPAAQFVVRGSIGPAPGPPRHQPRPAADS